MSRDRTPYHERPPDGQSPYRGRLTANRRSAGNYWIEVSQGRQVLESCLAVQRGSRVPLARVFTIAPTHGTSRIKCRVYFNPDSRIRGSLLFHAESLNLAPTSCRGHPLEVCLRVNRNGFVNLELWTGRAREPAQTSFEQVYLDNLLPSLHGEHWRHLLLRVLTEHDGSHGRGWFDISGVHDRLGENLAKRLQSLLNALAEDPSQLTQVALSYILDAMIRLRGLGALAEVTTFVPISKTSESPFVETISRSPFLDNFRESITSQPGSRRPQFSLKDLVFEYDASPWNPKNVQLADVRFNYCCPGQGLEPGTRFAIHAFIHLSEHERIVRERIEQLSSHPSNPRAWDGSIGLGNAGILFSVMIEIPGLQLDVDRQPLHWSGEIQGVTFLVQVPDGAKSDIYRGQVVFDAGGGSIRTLPIHINVRPKRAVRAFVSYASKDLQFVEKMTEVLLSDHPVEFFLAHQQMPTGIDYPTRIEQEIRQCNRFYLFWSEFARMSHWVPKEVALALSVAEERRIAIEDFFRPYQLDAVEQCPPPSGLRRQNFTSLVSLYAAWRAGKWPARPPDEPADQPTDGPDGKQIPPAGDAVVGPFGWLCVTLRDKVRVVIRRIRRKQGQQIGAD